MASTGRASASARRSSRTFGISSAVNRSSSRRVPEREMSTAGKMRRSLSSRDRYSSMLARPESATDEAVDIHAYGVRHTRFNSRKVSGGGTLLGDLAQLKCRIRVLWGVGDDSAFRPADLLIGEIRAAAPGIDVHRVPAAGHWSAFENAPEVNRLMLEFFATP